MIHPLWCMIHHYNPSDPSPSSKHSMSPFVMYLDMRFNSTWLSRWNCLQIANDSLLEYLELDGLLMITLLNMVDSLDTKVATLSVRKILITSVPPSFKILTAISTALTTN
eukprot:GHVO01068886.1.p2 GENE.GHVO01068886.1~~GHVO01068886.1.p2  ORF type:complete len:110 (-),score=9.55 GHVO01068886.1:82-411(-)